MTAESVKRLLPIIEAFANKQPVFVRRRGYSEWARLNPNTTEFRLKDLDDDEIEWSLTGVEVVINWY